MRAQKLPRKFRDRFGFGDWLFDNTNYWELNIAALIPLKEFLQRTKINTLRFFTTNQLIMDLSALLDLKVLYYHFAVFFQ